MKPNLITKIQLLNVISFCILLALFINCKKETEVPIIPSEKDSVPRFIGTFGVSSECAVLGTASYSIKIIKDNTADNSVIINNFFGNEMAVTATVSGLNITVPDQTVKSGTNSFRFVGSGNITEATNNVLTIEYEFSLPPVQTTAKCKFIARKGQ